MTLPYLNVPVFSWPAAPGGLLYTYSPGGVSAKTTYQADQVTPNTNPVVLDVNGTAIVRGEGLYHFLLKDSTGSTTLWDGDYYAGAPLSATTLAPILFPQTLSETNAGVTPVNYGYQEGDVRRYGALLDGTTDDTVALRNWVLVGGALSFPVARTAVITGEVAVFANTTITGGRGSIIKQTTANLGVFRATSQSNIHIQGIHFKHTSVGASAYVGGIVYDTCTNCSALNNEFEGFQWNGVYIRASSFCTVKGNYFHDFYNGEAITFTVAPALGATSGTLTTAWTNATGSYTVGFVETAGGAVEGRVVVLTNGHTTADWSASVVGPALTANCNAGANVNCISDSCDIGVHSNLTTSAAHNIIEGNFCYGGCHVGISVQDPYSGVLPIKNVITNNRISVHQGYGILNYMPDAGDSYNQIIGNFIAGITGSYALNQSAGAGIYSVGAGSGGLIVAGNTIVDCCKSTANTTLAPGGIGIAGTSAGTQPIAVTGNSIDGMTKYHGIILTGVVGGAAVSGNVIRQPAANTTGHAIYVVNSDAVAITGNKITQLNVTSSQRCILMQCIAASVTNCSIVGNTITGGHVSQVETAVTTSGSVSGLTIQGNTMDGGDSSCIPLLFQSGSAANVIVSGNYVNSLTSIISITGSTGIQFTGNRFKGPGATALFITSGTCTSCFYDRSNMGIVATVAINNAGTGAIVETTLTGNSDPAAGTYAVGDTVWRTDAVTGQRAFACCTVAGTSGTWKTVSLS